MDPARNSGRQLQSLSPRAAVEKLRVNLEIHVWSIKMEMLFLFHAILDATFKKPSSNLGVGRGRAEGLISEELVNFATWPIAPR